MNRFRLALLFFASTLGFLLSGCSTPQCMHGSEKALTQTDKRVDFTDPVLNNRKILLFGTISKQESESVIQKLLFLDSKSHAPIDLYLVTPGGELQYALAIYQTMQHINSPINTYALSECYSGGALLLAAGTGKRRAFQGAVILIHGLHVSGKLSSPLLKAFQSNYTEFWRKRSHLPQSWLPLPFNSVHVLSPEQALQYGIIDQVINK